MSRVNWGQAESLNMVLPSKRSAERMRTFRRTQRGQSLVEMAIALLVLVPLAAGVMLLGQYIHIKQQTQAAARAAAWEATVSPEVANRGMPDRARVLQSLGARQFSNTKTGLTSATQNPQVLGDPMLTTFANQELLKPAGITLTVYSQEKGPGVFDKALGKLERVSNTLPPNPNGLVTAEVHARPELIKGADGGGLAFLAPLDTMQLDFSAKTVLLADAWNAAGGGEKLDGNTIPGASNRTVRLVVKPLVPTALVPAELLGGLTKVMNFLDDIPFFNKVLTTNFGKLAFGKVAPDAVPADKLVNYANPK